MSDSSLMDATLHLVQTGTTIATQLGFTATEPELGNWPSKDTKFLVADEVKEMALFIIKKYRTDLVNVNIGYAFKQKASKNGDMTVFGTAQKVADLQKTFHSLEALIVIGFDTWQTLDLDGRLRLVYHELEHLGFDEKSGGLVTIPHPVEEFPSVVQVFGPGKDADIAFINAYNAFSKAHGK